MRSRLAVFTLLILVLGGDRVAAQSESPAVGLDVGVGVASGGGGGPWHVRHGVAASIVAARRWPSIGSGGVIGVSVAAQRVIDGTELCAVTATGGCAPDFPTFTVVGLLGGWQTRGGGIAGVRAVGGVGLAHSSAGWRVGPQGRLDIAFPARGHVALVGWGAATLLPGSGDSYRLAATGIGIRLR